MHLAAILSADGLVLLTMLIKLHSSTNKAKGLNMEMSDGERMARIVGYDLYFYFDYLPGLCNSSSSLRAARARRGETRLKHFILPICSVTPS